jgi:hypothetical protein
MSPFAIVAALTIALWAILFGAASFVLRRASNSDRVARYLLVVAVAVGILAALGQSGDDPIPSFLVGQILGSTFVWVFPVAVAVALDSKRRRSAEASRAK